MRLGFIISVKIYHYKMGKKSLQLQQLNSKMQAFDTLQKVAIPPTGWIKAIRTALSMSLKQLGKKLSRQGKACKILKEEKRMAQLR